MGEVPQRAGLLPPSKKSQSPSLRALKGPRGLAPKETKILISITSQVENFEIQPRGLPGQSGRLKDVWNGQVLFRVHGYILPASKHSARDMALQRQIIVRRGIQT